MKSEYEVRVKFEKLSAKYMGGVSEIEYAKHVGRLEALEWVLKNIKGIKGKLG